MFELVSTFGKQHLEIYGRTMIDSFEKNLVDINLNLYYDNPEDFINYKKIKLISFNDRCGSQFNEFKKISENFVSSKIRHPINSKEYENNKEFYFDAVRFSFKMFALIDFYYNFFDKTKNRYLVWVDGDTEAYKAIDIDWLKLLIPEDYYLSCLKRTKPFTETGFFILDCKHESTSVFMEQIKKYYYDFELFKLKHFIDCVAFDNARKLVETDLVKSFNLSTTPSGHVWRNSKIIERIDHYKGPNKIEKT
jgi:hypothetical protein